MATKTRKAKDFISKKDNAEDQFLQEKISKVKRALELKELIQINKTELDELKNWFDEKIFIPTGLTKFSCGEGLVSKTETNKYSVLKERVPDLKKIFGKSFDAYVKEKIEYGAETALRNKIKDDTFEHIDIIRDAVEIKTSTTIDFKPAHA